MLDTPAATALKGAALIADEVKRLPDKPGVYRMIGEDGEVLYVGKARSLKKRVVQYAQGRFHTNRIGRMVRETTAMEFVVTRTEIDYKRPARIDDSWQRVQVVLEMVAGNTVELGLDGSWIECSPWQSVQTGASVLPRAAATPCTLAR